MSPLSPILPNQLSASRSISPTTQQQLPSCLSPSSAVAASGSPIASPIFQEALSQGGNTNTINTSTKVQPNTIVFQPSTPSTLAVPNLVGKTQAVAATKRAFLEVRLEDYVYFYVYPPSNSLKAAFSNCVTSEE